MYTVYDNFKNRGIYYVMQFLSLVTVYFCVGYYWNTIIPSWISESDMGLIITGLCVVSTVLVLCIEFIARSRVKSTGVSRINSKFNNTFGSDVLLKFDQDGINVLDDASIVYFYINMTYALVVLCNYYVGFSCAVVILASVALFAATALLGYSTGKKICTHMDVKWC